MTLRFYKRGPVATQNDYKKTGDYGAFWRTKYTKDGGRGCNLADELLNAADFWKIYDSILASEGEYSALLPLEL